MHDESNPVVGLSLSTNNDWTRIQVDGTRNDQPSVGGKINLDITPTPVFLVSGQSVNIPLGQNTPSTSTSGPSGNNIKSSANTST